MEEKRITSFIGIYGSLILAVISEKDIISFSFMPLAILWAVRYFYLIKKEKQ